MSPLRPLALAAIVSIAAAAPASARTRPAVPPPPGAPREDVRLSNERTFTRWANAVTSARVYAGPAVTARLAGRLRFLTEDGFPEVYVLLDGHVDDHGVAWVRLRLPGRPNGVTGWVRRSALGPVRLVRTRLVVRRAVQRVTLYVRGRRRFTARVGVGKPGTPTPSGHFWIREKFHVHGNPLYGRRALGTAAYSDVLTDWPGGGVIGLHGTDEPGLIPGRPSHGCIRLPNPDIVRLYRLTPIGTPLLIR
jgi:lipoprotein-anchoring transpeptidase ErfK/SrfK